MHPFLHLKTINHHRRLVRKHCFRCGLYLQGLTHDLSKYSPVEFWSGAKYFQGNRSPNDAQREDLGYTSAWLHHKGRNKHHLEYWIDYSPDKKIEHALAGMRMPERYVSEMVCDRMAASKTYKGAAYKDSDPWDYYMAGKDRYLLHPETRAQLEYCLALLKDRGEDELFSYIKNELLPNAKDRHR